MILGRLLTNKVHFCFLSQGINKFHEFLKSFKLHFPKRKYNKCLLFSSFQKENLPGRYEWIWSNNSTGRYLKIFSCLGREYMNSWLLGEAEKATSPQRSHEHNRGHD
jgi:hypothetical protein